MPIPSWQRVQVHGTWVDHEGVKLSGSYKVTVPVRLTTVADDLIVPAGPFAAGPLNVVADEPSLSIMVPATDDPDIVLSGWKLEIVVTFVGGQASEQFVLDVPYANRPTADGGNGLGVNLREIVLAANMPKQNVTYPVGAPGGFALLSADGQSVLDSDGDPITGGGGVSAWDDLTGKPAVIAAGATAAAARDAIGAAAADDLSTVATSGAYGDLSGRPTLGTAAAVNTGTGAANVILGNDSRLTDARTPMAHTHAQGDITGLTAALSAKATPADITTAINGVIDGADPTLNTIRKVAEQLGSQVRTDTAAQGLNSTQQANARTNIGAGTSSLALGTTPTTAAAGNHTHTAATTSAAGPVELATNAETTTGTDTTRAVTPAGLKAALDSLPVGLAVIDPASLTGIPDGTLIGYTT